MPIVSYLRKSSAEKFLENNMNHVSCTLFPWCNTSDTSALLSKHCYEKVILSFPSKLALHESPVLWKTPKKKYTIKTLDIRVWSFLSPFCMQRYIMLYKLVKQFSFDSRSAASGWESNFPGKLNKITWWDSYSKSVTGTQVFWKS